MDKKEQLKELLENADIPTIEALKQGAPDDKQWQLLCNLLIAKIEQEEKEKSQKN